MKRSVTLLALAILAAASMVAQISVTNSGGYLLLDDKGYNLDALILLNGIDASTTLTYTGSDAIEWRYTIDSEPYSSTQPSITPDHNTLYTIYVAGHPQYYVYTIDYSVHRIGWHNLEIVADEESQCDYVTLRADATISPISYTDSAGTLRTLPRTCTLSWTDSSWNGTEWADSAATISVPDPLTGITVDAPKCNTVFHLCGDNWTTDMGITPDSISADYTAIRIRCHPVATVIEREYLNEKDRSSESAVEGSGPLTVEVLSNTNPIDGVYYEWFVASVETPQNYKRYNDVNLNYTFVETGEYTVKLTASNGTCQYSDSLNVKVTESYIEAPNVFTPNGDGMNDEWRVAYRSIERYSCIIQNRWGRTVFRSDNPGKGWDGTIGGRPASVGTYYYVIIAYGTDTDLKGKQKRYRLSGDINLLR